MRWQLQQFVWKIRYVFLWLIGHILANSFTNEISLVTWVGSHRKTAVNNCIWLQLLQHHGNLSPRSNEGWGCYGNKQNREWLATFPSPVAVVFLSYDSAYLVWAHMYFILYNKYNAITHQGMKCTHPGVLQEMKKTWSISDVLAGNCVWQWVD